METVMYLGNLLKAALGLGFVVYIHELGHFLLAKWNGVKVDRFSMGFGPTLLSYRKGVGVRVGKGSRPPGPGDPPTWGETEYVLAALPLGGYVLMLGESEESAEAAEPSADPKAFNNKSVFARMGIITAGVILNVILGVFCFAIVQAWGGLREIPARLGGVFPGTPAYVGGLRAGDEIVAIDGKRDVDFNKLNQLVALSGTGQKIKFTVKRHGVEGEKTLDIEPRRGPGQSTPKVGIYSGHGLELVPESPVVVPPGSGPGPGSEAGASKAASEFKEGDVIVAVGPEGGAADPVADLAAFYRKLETYRDRPITILVEHRGPNWEEIAAGPPVPREPHAQGPVTLPPHRAIDFGLRMTPGPVAAIRPDSPASKAGIAAGDSIVAVDGDRDYPPMRLPDYCRDRAGKPVALTIQGPARDGKPGPTREVTVTPDDSIPWIEGYDGVSLDIRADPLDVAGLGLALAVEPRVAAVRPDSPASKAGIRPGDLIRSIVVAGVPIGKEKAKPRPITLTLDGNSATWSSAVSFLQETPWESIEVVTDKTTKPVKIAPEFESGRFLPLRGLMLLPFSRKAPAVGPGEALKRGSAEAFDTGASIFGIFKSLAQGRLGVDAFGGIIQIGRVAYGTASAGWVPFAQFLGVLSINLAVLNFLPIPPLDGGKFLFLAAEKVRGRPLPAAALNAMQLAGIVFVLGLILFVNVKDVVQLVRSYL